MSSVSPETTAFLAMLDAHCEFERSRTSAQLFRDAYGVDSLALVECERVAFAAFERAQLSHSLFRLVAA